MTIELQILTLLAALGLLIVCQPHHSVRVHPPPDHEPPEKITATNPSGKLQ